MHNNIMAAGSRDRPPMLAMGRYAQWRSRFLRYIDTKTNGDALRKCILEGPYIPSTVVIQVVPATENSLAVPKHTTVETILNMSLANNAHFESEMEAIHKILTGIGDEIYSTVDACNTAHEMWEAIERLQQEWSRFVTIVKQKHKLDEDSYHKFFDILKQYQKEVNELHAERIAKNANPLALVATAQPHQDPYYQTSKSHKSYAPTSRTSLPSRSNATTRHKGKEIAKPITPPSESASEEDNDPEQAQKDKEMKPKGVKTPRYLKENDVDVEIDKQEVGSTLKLYGKDSRRFLYADTGTDLSHWNRNAKMFVDVMMRLVALANLIANLKLDVDENKNIQNQLKKANALLTQELKECKSTLAETSRTLGESNSIRELVDQTWVKHLRDHFHAPTTKDMEILIKTCLMPLALKTQNDSFAFVHELKKEMHVDLKYVESLENEIGKLESDKAEFSNMYDMLLQECVSNDVMCSYLHLLSDLDAHTELQCLYLHKVKECEYLKAQLQDKNIAICELNKLIEKCKEKSVETKFDNPSIVRQPNAQRIPKPLVLEKLAPFSDSLERKKFSKKKSVPKTNKLEGLSKPITLQNLPQTATQDVRNTNVIKPCMYRINARTTQTRAPQFPQTSRNTNPCVSTSTGVIHRTNVSRPQLRSTQMKDKVVPNNSHVKNKKTEVEDHHRISSISNKTKSITMSTGSLKSRTLNVNVVCATCGKCVFNLNHDACVSKYLNDVNARTKKPKVVPISTRKPKSQANKSVATPHKKTVASESTTQKSKSYYRMLYEKTSKAWKWWIEQQCPLGYKWVSKTKTKWVPKVRNENIVQLILFIVDSRCTKHMTGNLTLLCNFVEKYLGTVRFGNDQFALILGYGDLVQGNITINRVYYVEGLNHNLF
ncbi:hypothetical protein Tco_0158575 [Tanacetum coccineum]